MLGSSSAGTNNYLPPTGVSGASRFGRLAQFGVMNTSNNSSTVISSTSNGTNSFNENNIGGTFTSGLGFGRHKV